jgi:hypothetical protein
VATEVGVEGTASAAKDVATRADGGVATEVGMASIGAGVVTGADGAGVASTGADVATEAGGEGMVSSGVGVATEAGGVGVAT